MNERERIFDLFEEQQDFLKERVTEGIERYRKGDCVLTVTDRQGNPIPNAVVRLEQKTHEFRFGANIFMLDELESSEKNEKYKAAFRDVFNMATLPFYWNTLEPERGQPRYAKDSARIYRRPPIDRCIEFCEKNGIEPREHGLAYDRFFPEWLSHASTEEVKAAFSNRCEEIASRYADRIPTIEVTNEMEWERGTTAFYDQPDYVAWCFRTAAQYFPHNLLCINEHTGLCWEDRGRATDKYYSYIEANMLRGARIDAIGMQYHLFYKREEEYRKTRLTLNPRNLYRHMDLYAGLGKPLQITEVTIPAFSWEKEDEEIQAALLEQLYSIWFSHPSVSQIVYWNLVDGYAHVWDTDEETIRASQGNMALGENYYYGGLLRFDLSPKPAYAKLKELIQKRWHTALTLVTDENGKASFRGFYGNYDLEITANACVKQAELLLSSHGDNDREVMV